MRYLRRRMSRGVFGIAVLPVLTAAWLAACGGGTVSSSPTASSSVAGVSPSWSPTVMPAPIPVLKPGDELPTYKDLAAMFVYDTTEPLNFEKKPAAPQAGCTVDAIWYDCGGNDATGYLVMPKGEGPFPVVVYAPGWKTDADMFLEDAVALAGEGVAGLLLNEPYWVAFWSFDPEGDTAAVVQYAIQERRGLDLLETLPQIDAQRIGFVGWSNGAHLCGGIICGLDDRIRAYALIGMARPTSNYRGLIPEEDLPFAAEWDRMAAQLALMDPITYVGYNRTSAFLLLNGEGDRNAMQDAEAFLSAAPKPKVWEVYDGGHTPTPEAEQYWRRWMLENL